MADLAGIRSTAPVGRRRGAFARAAGTVLSFALVGPLIGGVAVGMPDVVYFSLAGGDVGTVLYFLLVLAAVGFPAALTVGLVPAAAVGMFFAAVDFGRRRSNAWLAMVAGALGGVLWPMPWGLPPATLSSSLELQIFAASVGSTLVCWYLSTRRSRRPEAAPA